MKCKYAILLMSVILAACQPPPATASVLPPGPAAPTATRPVRTPAPSALFFDGFKMFDSQSGWAWRGVSELYRTDDGGTTWKEILLQGRMQVPGAEFLDGQHAWLLGVPDSNLKQGVFKTVDGGRTWKELSHLPGPNISLTFHDVSNGWALNGMAGAGNIFYQAYQTIDGGRSWKQLQATSPGGQEQGVFPGTIHVATGDSISFRSPQTIWIASGSGLSTPYAGLTVSRDNGITWQQINPVLPVDYLADQPPVTVTAPQFVSDRVAYLPVTVGKRLVFFASQDYGDTWKLLPPVLSTEQMLPPVQFTDTLDGFAVCGTKLCATQDGAASWHEIATPFAFDPSGGSSVVSEFDFVDKEIGWAILADRQGGRSFLETTDGGRTWIELSPRLSF